MHRGFLCRHATTNGPHLLSAAQMRLSVLDQSPVIHGLGARRALEETIALARRADELGYHRYWLAEHHAIAALADPAPEILVSRVACATSRIPGGTGGVLFPHYSPPN